jgi:hypothetical protein
MKKYFIDEIIISIVCAVGVVSLIGVGMLSGYTHCNNQWTKIMIERKYVEYNTQTGEWQWREPEHIEGINQDELKIELSDS